MQRSCIELPLENAPIVNAFVLAQVSVCAIFGELFTWFAQNYRFWPMAAGLQRTAPQTRTSNEAMPIAIKAKAVPVAIEVCGT